MTDREYQIARDKLIPEAVKIAETSAGDRPVGSGFAQDEWSRSFTEAFHSAINTLAFNNGLIDQTLYDYTELKVKECC